MPTNLPDLSRLKWHADFVNTAEAKLAIIPLIIIAGLAEVVTCSADAISAVQVRGAGVIIDILTHLTDLASADISASVGGCAAHQWWLTCLWG